jgi:hypothetical protein
MMTRESRDVKVFETHPIQVFAAICVDFEEMPGYARRCGVDGIANRIHGHHVRGEDKCEHQGESAEEAPPKKAAAG